MAFLKCVARFLNVCVCGYVWVCVGGGGGAYWFGSMVVLHLQSCLGFRA